MIIGDGADLDEGVGPRIARRRGHPARALAHQAREVALETADEVHHGIGSGNGVFDAAPVAHVAARELQLAEIGKRLERKRLFRIAAGDSQARAALEMLKGLTEG